MRLNCTFSNTSAIPCWSLPFFTGSFFRVSFRDLCSCSGWLLFCVFIRLWCMPMFMSNYSVFSSSINIFFVYLLCVYVYSNFVLLVVYAFFSTSNCCISSILPVCFCYSTYCCVGWVTFLIFYRPYVLLISFFDIPFVCLSSHN
jgi:hypothetical protein